MPDLETVLKELRAWLDRDTVRRECEHPTRAAGRMAGIKRASAYLKDYQRRTGT